MRDDTGQIFRLGTVWLAVLAGSALVPRFVSVGEGFAAAVSAVLVFLALVAVALAVSILLFFRAWRVRAELDFWARLVGFVPLVVSAAILVAAWILLRF